MVVFPSETRFRVASFLVKEKVRVPSPICSPVDQVVPLRDDVTVPSCLPGVSVLPEEFSLVQETLASARQQAVKRQKNLMCLILMD